MCVCARARFCYIVKRLKWEIKSVKGVVRTFNAIIRKDKNHSTKLEKNSNSTKTKLNGNIHIHFRYIHPTIFTVESLYKMCLISVMFLMFGLFFHVHLSLLNNVFLIVFYLSYIKFIAVNARIPFVIYIYIPFL